MPIKTLLTSILCILVLSFQCFANNNLFLPGDAFFPTVMTKDVVDKSEAVAHCWRDGPLIPAMPATIPDIKVGQKEQAAVSIECSVMAIVLANGTFEDFFDSDGEEYLRIYVVTSEGIEEWINHEWEWKRVK